MALISVIVPVYNVECYLQRCIDSIREQTFTDFTVILVDDGSPDSSGHICDETASIDKRFLVIHQENGGLSAARNSGIDRTLDSTECEWITFIDSDDWVHPEYLETLLHACLDNNCMISQCGFFETSSENQNGNRTGHVINKVSPEENWCTDQRNATVAWGKLYHRSIWETGIRFPEKVLHEDEFTVYKLLFQQRSVAVTEDELYFYFINSSGITKRAWSEKRLDAFTAITEQLSYFKNNRYYKAYNTSFYCFFLCYQIQSREMTEKQMNEYLPEIRRKIKREYHKNKKIISFPEERKESLYSVLNPFNYRIICKLKRFGINIRFK